MNDGDRQLCDRIEQHQTEALAAAYDRYAQEVYSIAMGLLDNPAAAEGMVEAVFLDLWRQPPALRRDGGHSLRSWLVGQVSRRSLGPLERWDPGLL